MDSGSAEVGAPPPCETSQLTRTPSLLTRTSRKERGKGKGTGRKEQEGTGRKALLTRTPTRLLTRTVPRPLAHTLTWIRRQLWRITDEIRQIYFIYYYICLSGCGI